MQLSQVDSEVGGCQKSGVECCQIKLEVRGWTHGNG